jgi:hypothetical protein
MCIRYVAVKPIHWGLRPQAFEGQLPRAVLAPAPRGAAHVAACAIRTIVCLVAIARIAAADPVAATSAPSSAVPAPSIPPASFVASWDLDGTYLWLGPLGAASRIASQWDSTFGADAALVVVRERAPLGLYGANLGASRWTERGGGRVWVDGLAGTHLLDHMVGISLGPIVELSELAHPRLGGSIGLWGFAGVTPFARLGAVADLGAFAEIGIHIALPVLRR